jgi:hypothetical protein
MIKYRGKSMATNTRKIVKEAEISGYSTLIIAVIPVIKPAR